MRILISNDDGYSAPGIQALTAALADLGELVVVAPENNHSGASNSLTLNRPLTVREAAKNHYVVNGTPSDCVHIGLTAGLMERPHLVVSGINNGANMGDDTIYSGTVAAATEGYFFGIPAIAFSLTEKGWPHIEAAAQVARRVVQYQIAHPLPVLSLLSVNIPALPLERMGGIEVTRLGKRHVSNPVIPTQTPSGETAYWIGQAGQAADAAPGTDFHAIGSGRVSLTPLRLDLTDHEQLTSVRDWAEPLWSGK